MSCLYIITVQKKDDFGKEFIKGRTLKRYTQYSDIQNNFDSVNLFIIQIYGSKGIEDLGIDDIEDKEIACLKRAKGAERITDSIFRRMDIRCNKAVNGGICIIMFFGGFTKQVC